MAILHLCHARTMMYDVFLGRPATRREEMVVHLDKAVSCFRASARLDALPLVLFERATWHSQVMNMFGAQADLDEAWEIAERGSMNLHLADIHLHRARLFGRSVGRSEKYPWESPQADLAAAERLIHACGYHRRDEELAAAKAALKTAEL